MRCSAVTSFLAMIVFTAACALAVDVKLKILARSALEKAVTNTHAPGNPAIKVWARQNSGFYYCPATNLYGRDESGMYLSETAALDQGYRPAAGATCSEARH